MLILQPKRKHKYLSCETFIWKKMARSSMGNLLFGKKYKYLLGIAFFWEKIQISSRDCLLFEKKHKYLLVTATFSEKQRIPCVWRLLFEKKQQISFSYGYFFWKTTNSMRVTAAFSEKRRIPCMRRLQIDSYEKKRERKVSITPSFHSLHPELCLYDRWSFYVTLLQLYQQWSEISLLTLILLCSRYYQMSFL